MEKYNSYTTDDFLNDDYFITYCKYGEEEAVRAWDNWLQSHPDNESAFRQAHAWLTAVLGATRITAPAYLENHLWEHIQEDISLQEKKLQRKRYVRMFATGIAACLCLLVASLWYVNSRVTVSTTLGEHRTITLPDNSEVTLNANSSLTYYRAWWWHKKREVWLAGEGLFKVQYQDKDAAGVPPAERFTAYAGKLKVEVLGTTFNVKERRNRVIIALLEGKVKVTEEAHVDKPVILQKGEVFRMAEGKVETSQVNQLTNQPQAWVDRKIVATGMTVQDIINNYEDTYGVQIILDNPSLAQKTIDGTISIGTDDNLLFMLANILNADIDRKGKQIWLRSK
ncbi:FecR family protein [Filimonas lacunae]|uniref:FecR family protein n=1 Tax=Filimonas lacunae TaxID=477680 RepID=A0A173MMN9_9BACT|nr:FecR domain-containing protein [Filimonas lacunae]BAV08913.1 anti-sigma factor [Filimonas lacunae]SIS63898.1 FecR family protein [Filimonas lacunae]